MSGTTLPEAPGPWSAIQSLVDRRAPLDEIIAVLDQLQERGYSQNVLRVELERLRVVNDLGARDDETDDLLLSALDAVEGWGRPAMRWDSHRIAAVRLGRLAGRFDLARAAENGLHPSDLLPPRPSDRPSGQLLEYIVRETERELGGFALEPQRADFFRVPKDGFSSRPAALLGVSDRLVYEALARQVEAAIDSTLVAQVLWPRSSKPQASGDFRERPLEFGTKYVVVADIESFYESVDHDLLSRVLSRSGVPLEIGSAIQPFLTAVMGSTRGLPQGPGASDILASGYICDVDRLVASLDVPFVRYADDYLMGVGSVREGRRLVEELEIALQRIGLRVNSSKLRVLRMETYRKGLQGSAEVERMREALRKDLERYYATLDEVPDGLEDLLVQAGATEDLLWGVLYHHAIGFDEVFAELGESFGPSSADAAATVLERAASDLRSGSDSARIGERDLAQCFLLVSNARREVPWATVETLLTWHPALADSVARHLRSRLQDDPAGGAQFGFNWIRQRQSSDWARGWIVSAFYGRGDILVGDLLGSLTDAVRDSSHGVLTAMSSAFVLAEAGKLPRQEFESLWAESSKAVRTELAIAVSPHQSLFGNLKQLGSGDPPAGI